MARTSVCERIRGVFPFANVDLIRGRYTGELGAGGAKCGEHCIEIGVAPSARLCGRESVIDNGFDAAGREQILRPVRSFVEGSERSEIGEKHLRPCSGL